jgi:acetylglutamate kinase
VAIIVLKLGGELLLPTAAAEAQAIAADVASLCAAGHRLTIVHGGGPQATELARRLGHQAQVVGGRRVTDRETLEVMKMAVAGQVNVDLCALLGAAGVRPVGLHGASGPMIVARKRPPRRVTGGPPQPIDLGHVGDVVSFDRALLDALAAASYLPVLACLGCEPQTGAILNINADVVSTQLAATLGADKLLMVTGAPGVLADPTDPTTRLPRLSRAEAQAAIAAGRIQGGMIPKLEEAFQALSAGVGEVHVLGRLAPGDLARAVAVPGSVGTALLP